MTPKEYQARALETLDGWLDELAKESALAAKRAALAELNPELGIEVGDWTAKAWTTLRDANRLPERYGPDGRRVPFSPRTDGIGRPVPNACLKVPTAGGKTFLACAAIGRIQARLLKSNHGLVLWVVPNEAIYRQTYARLKDRGDPYRALLDRAAAGRVRVLDKDSQLNAADVEANLCVMVLMLQSANRETRESLRVFRDRGNVHGFTPPEGEPLAHARLKAAVPNLATYRDRGGTEIVKDSLGNALALARPVIVLDEGHRGFSSLAMQTIYGFNPTLVLELSATPKDRVDAPTPLYANWLVDIRGTALAAEEMIKLPIDLLARAGDDWKDVLRESLDRLDILQREAEAFRQDSGRYIRPILLVQVERTGKEERGAGFIHAEDAREHLLTLGLRADQIALKTADANDLKAADLLSPLNPIRAIITRSALQEGWDCPFAYVLCCLAANRTHGALTQLLGRILRQPGARRTGVAALDECYVLTHRAETAVAVKAIRKGLEDEGMGDLAANIRERDPATGDVRRIRRRPEHASTEIYLPRVLWIEAGETPRPLDYDADILARLDYRGVDLKPLIGRLRIDGTHEILTERRRLGLGAGGEAEAALAIPDATSPPPLFDLVHAVRSMADLVPNAFAGARLVQTMLQGLRARGATDSQLGSLSVYLLEELRQELVRQVDALAEARFRALLDAGIVQFRLRLDGRDWRMPTELPTMRAPSAPQFTRTDGTAAQLSLFSPAFREDYNDQEYVFACYLDAAGTIAWWHRNVVRGEGYAIQGWRRHRIYPDFLFAQRERGGRRELFALEMKGDQLGGNDDTTYKSKVLDAVTEAYQQERMRPAGECEIVGPGGLGVRCRLVLMRDWRTTVLAMLDNEAG